MSLAYADGMDKSSRSLHTHGRRFWWICASLVDKGHTLDVPRQGQFWGLSEHGVRNVRGFAVQTKFSCPGLGHPETQ